MLQSVGGDEQLSADDSELNSRTSRLELLAVVRGLEAIDRPARVTLLTGSRYVSRGIRRQLSQWRDDNWQWERFGELVPIRDSDLWQRVDHALQFHQVECCDWQADDRDQREPGRGWLAVCSGYGYAATRHFDATYGHLANDVYSGRLTAHNNTAPPGPRFSSANGTD